MEAFSLLKYWKSANTAANRNRNGKLPTVSVIAAIDNHDEDEDEDDSVSDGPFFDLEFAVPDDVAEEEDKEDVRVKVEERETVYDEIEEEEEEDVEEAVVHVDGSDAVAEMEEIIQTAFTGSKSGQFPVSLVKSATKLKVFMSGLKRSKSEVKVKQIAQQNNNGSKNSKLLRVRLKMEEVKMPIMSLLTRATSNGVKNTAQEDDEKPESKTVSPLNNEEKRNNNNSNKKEVVEKYLKLVRPLYVKIYKKSNSEAAAEKKEKRRLSLKVKNLGKSKSAVVHSMSPRNGNTTKSLLVSKKSNNDWLLQQQDGIQGAIQHCKRSFNSNSSSSSSSSSEGGDERTSVLVRSVSNPSHEKKLVAEAEEEGRNGIVAG